MSRPFTCVALVFISQQVNLYLRFGCPVRERIVDSCRCVVVFAPEAVFCRIRWETNDYGTTCWHLSVLQAMACADTVQRVAGVVPGAALLLHACSAQNVQAVLRIIDAIEAQRIDPADVPATYWRVTHNRLAARARPAPYTIDRHAVYMAHRAFR